jgi:hypothetical protein
MATERADASAITGMAAVCLPDTVTAMQPTVVSQPDTLQLDTLSTTIDNNRHSKKGNDKPKADLPEHSPRKATVYSAILPGLGQLYNRRYLKAPIVYAGFAAFVYFIGYNNDLYVQYRQAYLDITDEDPTSKSYEKLKGLKGGWDFTNPSHITQLTRSLERAKESSQRTRDLCIIGTAAFYGLNILDATVDGHFFDFDISDDLSFKWSPETTVAFDRPLIGFHCIIKF